MKNTSLAVVAGVAIVVGALAWYWTHQGATPAAGAKNGPGATVVDVVTPQRRDVPVLLQANGSVTPVSSVDLHPQVTATIDRVHIREGQFVKAGDLMFSLDARGAQANVAKAEATLQRDRAALADAERQHRRSVDLLSRNFVAQGAVDTLQSTRDAAQGLLAADTAALRAAQVEASYNVIRAPMAGRVGAIGVYAGSLVQVSTSLTTITQLDPINVSFTLPESSLAGLLVAYRAGNVGVTATADGGKDVHGKLSFIDNSVDPQAGVIRVKAEFSNTDTALWPGQYVNTRLTVQTLKNAVVIPQNAIISNTNGIFVYILAPDQTAQIRNVVRLYGFGADAAVTGLSGDEKVIVDGKQNVRPGVKVQLSTPAPGKPA